MSFPYLAALSYRAVVTEYAAARAFHTGAKGMTEDGSEYRLCKAGAAMTSPISAAINYHQYLTPQTGTCLEGATTVAIVDGDVTATIGDTNTRAVNFYKDGYFVIPTSTVNSSINPIWKNDLGDGTSIKVYLSSPIKGALALGATVQAYPNPWSDVRAGGAYAHGYEHFVCCPEIPVSSGYYFWGKVKGPHWSWVFGTWPGAAANDRDVVFHNGGTFRMADESINTAAVSNQRAGYLMFSGNYGDALLMLQIE